MVEDETLLDPGCVIAWLEEEFRRKGNCQFPNMEEKCEGYRNYRKQCFALKKQLQQKD